VAIVRTAGGILWRSGLRTPRLAVIHRPRQDDWTLPKGKLEAGESWNAAALREVREETGCTARLTTFAGANCYEVRRGLKIVLYWNMEVVRQGPLERRHEVDEVLWLRPDEALDRLDHARERRLVERAFEHRSPVCDAVSLVHRAEAAIAGGDLDRAQRLIEATQRAA
jgi:8-oxo-dGTP pyrophosphatase MutT (NUDIX family)